MYSKILELSKQLISIPSVTPNDLGCQDIIISRLLNKGFLVKKMIFGNTNNFWAYKGFGSPSLLFLGHTDVVPSGNESDWMFPPFLPTIKNGVLYGRGCCDMKGAISAIIVAVESFLENHFNHNGRLSFIFTSDEEGIADCGVVKVVDYLFKCGEKFDYCLIGEPTSNKIVGDIVKNGRRGSLTANLVVKGVKGHVGYPDLIDNPIHTSIFSLYKLLTHQWDKGNCFFSPTTMQITDIVAVSDAGNITPGELKAKFNFRFSNELTIKDICDQVDCLLKECNLNYSISWDIFGYPFLTSEGDLLTSVVNSIFFHQKIVPCLSTSGGTSDGRFVVKICSQIIELGLLNNTIHKVNECVKISDLLLLSMIYENIIERLFL